MFGDFATPDYNSGMVVRTEWRLRQQSPQFKVQSRRPVALSSRWIIGLLTAVYLFWLLVRAVSQPDWVLQLPPIVSEFVRAGGDRLAGHPCCCLWGLVWWRGRQEDFAAARTFQLRAAVQFAPG